MHVYEFQPKGQQSDSYLLYSKNLTLPPLDALTFCVRLRFYFLWEVSGFLQVSDDSSGHLVPTIQAGEFCCDHCLRKVRLGRVSELISDIGQNVMGLTFIYLLREIEGLWCRGNEFSIRVVDVWNKLINQDVRVESIECFKRIVLNRSSKEEMMSIARVWKAFVKVRRPKWR